MLERAVVPFEEPGRLVTAVSPVPAGVCHHSLFCHVQIELSAFSFGSEGRALY